MTKDNFCVGQFDLTEIEEAPRGIAEIEITFSVDINGIINVSAVDKKNSDNKKKITVTGNKGRLTINQINDLIRESQNMEMIDKIEREKKHYYHDIEDMCSNILLNLEDKEFKLKEHNKEHIKEDINQVLKWLRKELYNERDRKDYIKVMKRLKENHATLILKTNNSDNNVKAVANKNIAMTSVYEDDNDEEFKNEIYEKLNDENCGITSEMDVEDKKALKDIRNYLVEICYSVFELMSDDAINITDETQDKLKDIIDDTLLWVHIKEKIKKEEYQEKLDAINTYCNKLHDECQDSLFDNNKNDNALVEELEQLCCAIKNSIDNNILQVNSETVVILRKKINDTLDWLIEMKVKHKMGEDIDVSVYQKKIDEINKYCNSIYKTMDECDTIKISTDNYINKLDMDGVDDMGDMSGISLEDLRKMSN